MTGTDLRKIIDQAAVEALRRNSCENPVEALTRFENRFSILARRKLGNKLEAEGKNRYTGMPESGECHE